MSTPTELLGRLLGGKQLPTISPNATKEEQTELLNRIIAVLNNYSRDVILSGSTTLVLPAGQALGMTIIDHNLGYHPQVFAYLATNSTVNGVRYSNVDVPLPSPASYKASGTGHIIFIDYISYFVDSTKLYFLWASGILPGSDDTINIKYYLTRNPSS